MWMEEEGERINNMRTQSGRGNQRLDRGGRLPLLPDHVLRRHQRQTVVEKMVALDISEIVLRAMGIEEYKALPPKHAESDMMLQHN